MEAGVGNFAHPPGWASMSRMPCSASATPSPARRGPEAGFRPSLATYSNNRGTSQVPKHRPERDERPLRAAHSLEMKQKLTLTSRARYSQSSGRTTGLHPLQAAGAAVEEHEAIAERRPGRHRPTRHHAALNGSRRRCCYRRRGAVDRVCWTQKTTA